MFRIVFLLVVFAISLVSNAQRLGELYKAGSVRLVPDKAYGANTDWDKVFPNYFDSIQGKSLGDRRSLFVLPDGSVVVSHLNRDFFTKMNPDGSFDKEFKVLDKNGQPLKKPIQIEGILGNSTFFSNVDHVGNLQFFDFNGRYVKTLKLDYRVNQIIPLTGDKLAVVGWSLFKDKFRDFVAVVDYKTNVQKIIWDHMTTRPEVSGQSSMFNYRYAYKKGGMIGFTSMPFSKASGMSTPPILSVVNNNLIVAIPSTGEIRVYTHDGKLLNNSIAPWAKGFITAEEQKVIQSKAIDDYKSMKSDFQRELNSSKENEEAFRYIIREMEKDLSNIKDPIPLPYFSTIIKDSEGNLLIFEYPKETNANRFHVWIYDKTGKFDGECTFVCDDYILQINPSKMGFYNGYIYGLQKLSNTKGVPLRVVRFKLFSDEK